MDIQRTPESTKPSADDEPESTIRSRERRAAESESQKELGRFIANCGKKEKRIEDNGKRFYVSIVAGVEGKRVLSGSISQDSPRFPDSAACFGHSIAAACFKDPWLWRPKDFDVVLGSGFMAYKKMVNALSQSMFHHLEAPDAKLLNWTISVGNIEAKFTIDSVPYAAFVNTKLEPDQDRYVPLAEAIKRVFTKSKRALLCANDFWFCVALSEHKQGYFIINSHAVNERNEVQISGVARSFWCLKLEDFVKTIVSGLTTETCKGEDAYYQLYPMTVTSSNSAKKEPRQSAKHERDDDQDEGSDEQVVKKTRRDGHPSSSCSIH